MVEIKHQQFAENLKNAMARQGVSVTDIKNHLGITYEMARRYSLGAAKPRDEKLRRLAELLKVSPAELEYGDGSKAAPESNVKSGLRPIAAWDHEEELDPEQYVFLPALEIKLAAGNGQIVWCVEEKGQRQAFRKAWASRLHIDPECAATMVASGNSMEPRILDGDSLVVDYCRTTFKHGRVFALALRDELYVKRVLKRADGGVTLRSDNQDKARYPDIDVGPDEMEHLKVIGEIMALAGGMI
ncbi:XRE family transcriptional regulator [Crenobacter cavernae]|uniref:Helix-turn-helix transcriptional regulator n=1 Tax=Crenobacter cavernae TaxID=2290923 RepID=A0A345Y6T3_9NEIS|nr:S24 family peptidase [Crenobacter cavernae]AXK39635.1 helix-turn-helix transcriptional regulator [Crenobacter cavernae]